ncbi:MAG TPA: tetratricopeptide repeat protein [Gemmatimonadaceae bacterium]|nr:tetratricopeptide repeat protein [Gemmatimonadaceae bacterium]
MRTLAALSTLLAAASVGAQQQAQCEIDEGSPSQVATAAFFVSTAFSNTGKDNSKQLKNAIKGLTEKSDKFADRAGRNFVLGKALMAWLDQPNATPVMKRGDVGFTTNAEGTVDLALAADSAFTAVERALPQCAAQVSLYRRQQPWVRAVNGAVEALNAGLLDSADARARYSLVLYRGAPYAYTVLASVAQQRKDDKAAVGFLKQAIEASKSDTSFAEVGRGSLLNAASITADLADRAEGTERAALAKESADMFRTYIAQYPSDANVAVAQGGLGRALSLTGDTAAVSAMYVDMIANPSKYSAMQLFEAGVVAARAEKAKDAAALFEAGLQQNPYYRDALFNLAAVYFATDQFDKMLPVLGRLVQVDPNNPENWRMIAGAYQGKNRTTKDQARRKVYTDSLLMAFGKYEKMPAVVTFTLFSHDGPKHKLAGTIENRGDKASSYPLKVEFLDSKGNVVATKEAPVGPVAPKEKKTFSIDVDGSGIVAFRYAPLDG